MLFSATQSSKVEDLIRLSLKDPLFVSVEEKNSTATVATLEQVSISSPSPGLPLTRLPRLH